jgi:hypothetical protein
MVDDILRKNAAAPLAVTSQGVEQIGKDRHRRLLALRLENAGLVLLAHPHQLETHSRGVADRADCKFRQLKE